MDTTEWEYGVATENLFGIKKDTWYDSEAEAKVAARELIEAVELSTAQLKVYRIRRVKWEVIADV